MDLFFYDSSGGMGSGTYRNQVRFIVKESGFDGYLDTNRVHNVRLETYANSGLVWTHQWNLLDNLVMIGSDVYAEFNFPPPAVSNALHDVYYGRVTLTCEFLQPPEVKRVSVQASEFIVSLTAQPGSRFVQLLSTNLTGTNSWIPIGTNQVEVTAANFGGRQTLSLASLISTETNSAFFHYWPIDYFGANQAVNNYILVVGQSNARGIGQPLSTNQPYHNLMWQGGVLSTGETNETEVLTGFTPLLEAKRETFCTSFASQLIDFAGQRWGTAIGNFAKGGAAYSVLKKGGTGSNYANSIISVQTATNLLTAARVPGILVNHGESDGPNDYEFKAEEWQTDYQADIPAITGQPGILPMFHTLPIGPPDDSGYDVLRAHEKNPLLTVLVGPTYHLIHIDEYHMTNTAMVTVGEYYAKAFYHRVVLGETYSPLRPLSVTNVGTNIIVQFTGHVGRLVFDETTVSNPGNYGFTYTDAGTDPPTISSVTITDADAGIVTVALTGSPTTNVNKLLKYAAQPFGPPPYTPAPNGLARGNLRDSDPTVGRDGQRLYNWCVNFSRRFDLP